MIRAILTSGSIRSLRRKPGQIVGYQTRTYLVSPTQLDGRALAGLAVDRDMPAGLLHEAVNLGQAEARALADRFGREERFERPRRHLGRHARTRVADRD